MFSKAELATVSLGAVDSGAHPLPVSYRSLPSSPAGQGRPHCTQNAARCVNEHCTRPCGRHRAVRRGGSFQGASRITGKANAFIERLELKSPPRERFLPFFFLVEFFLIIHCIIPQISLTHTNHQICNHFKW